MASQCAIRAMSSTSYRTLAISRQCQAKKKHLQHERVFSNCRLNSSENLVTVPESRLSELLEAELAYFASVPVRAVSMREVLDALEPHRAAKFIQVDVPKRFAKRIRMIEDLSCWHRIPELVSMRDELHSWYKALRLAPRGPNVGLTEFTKVVRYVRRSGKDVVLRVTQGMHKLKQITGNEYSDETLNKWMDGFFLSRIGSTMLMDQYYACLSRKDGGKGYSTGIINPKCDAAGVCKQAAAAVTGLCLHEMGRAPPIVVEVYRAGKIGPQTDDPVHFSYIPGYLRYIMLEILKNSVCASVKNAVDDQDLQNRPVHILVSADDQEIAIRISDRAGGIPFQVGDRIWSYLYGAAAREGEQNAPVATALAGYGIGLPLSRLHARYLGGQLEVRSFPGFGTDVYLKLSKIDANQVELVVSA